MVRLRFNLRTGPIIKSPDSAIRVSHDLMTLCDDPYGWQITQFLQSGGIAMKRLTQSFQRPCRGQ